MVFVPSPVGMVSCWLLANAVQEVNPAQVSKLMNEAQDIPVLIA